jgi:hypothetical protein
MSSATIRQLTANATADDLADDDYRAIYEEVRSRSGLRQFASDVGGLYSIAWWSKYEHGEIELTRAARSALRQIVGMAALPLTVVEAAAAADPDAAVYQVGGDVADRVLLIGCAETVTVRINGAVEVIEDTPVTEVTRPRGRAARRVEISVPAELFERLNRARNDRGVSWGRFLGGLLEDERA